MSAGRAGLEQWLAIQPKKETALSRYRHARLSATKFAGAANTPPTGEAKDRAFAGTVRSELADDLARFDSEGHVAQRPPRLVPLAAPARQVP